MGVAASDEVRLAEYASLRHELNQRSTIQQALVALNLTVAGTVTGFVVSGHDLQELFLIVALTSSTLGLLWLDHHLSIHQIARYVRNELWKWEPSWERHICDQEKSRLWQVVYVSAVTLVFLVVAAAALAACWDSIHGPLRVLRGVALGLTAFSTIAFIVTFLRGSGRVK